jgi:hypothetical protein
MLEDLHFLAADLIDGLAEFAQNVETVRDVKRLRRMRTI